MKLYEIDAEIERLGEEAYDEETGEILNEELFKQIDELKIAREEKIENCCLYLKNLKSDAEQLKAEAELFSKRAKAAESRADSLKEYIRYALDGECFRTTRVHVYYRNTKSVEVNVPAEIIPKEYQRIKVEPDKTAIKEALNEGVAVEGCQLVEKKSIIIK